MTYLDFLLTHTYSELPEAVQAEIAAADYTARRGFALLLKDKPSLPPGLQQAYRHTVAEKQRPPRALPWTAAAGWLVAIALTALLMARPPHVEYVTVSAKPVVKRDTVIATLRDTVDRIVYQPQLHRDTFFAPAAPPRFVVVHDTVYRVPPTIYPSGTVRVTPASLSLLVGSRGE